MTLTYTTSAASGQSGIFRGNVALVSGIFSTSSSAVCTITTGLTGRLMACGVECTQNATTAPTLHRNTNSGNNASNGQIKIATFRVSDGLGCSGYWWAIGELN